MSKLSPVRNWRVVLAHAGERVERRLGRRLTEDEWQRLEATRFGSNHLELREVAYRYGFRLRPQSLPDGQRWLAPVKEAA